MSDADQIRPKPKRARAAWWRRLGRSALRWTGRLLLAIGVLLLLVISALGTLQLTAPGRAWVLDIALSQVNALIPGTIEARKLTQFNLLKIELWGLVARDPTGAEVARVGHVLVATDLLGLVSGKIALNEGLVEDAWVDLRVLEERRGLIAAFVDPDAPPSPPSPGPPPDVLIRSIKARSITARLPDLEPVGQIDARIDELRSDFSLIQGEPGVALERLVLVATRQSERLLSATLQGRLGRGAEATLVQMQAHTGPATVDLKASMVLPTHPKWQELPASCDLDVAGLEARHLAHVLRDPALAKAFLGQVSLALKAQGTPRDARGSGAITTNGGTLQLDELSATGTRLHARLSTAAIQLDQVRADLPPHRVGLELDASSEGLPPQPLRGRIALRKATIDGESLLDLDAAGTWLGSAVEGIDVQGRKGDSRLSVKGELDFSGETRLDARLDLRPDVVARLSKFIDQDLQARLQASAALTRSPDGQLITRGTLTVDELTLAPRTSSDPGAPASSLVELAHFDAQFAGQGQPETLEFAINAHLSSAKKDNYRLDEAHVEAKGTLQDIRARLRLEGGLGDVMPGAARDPKNAARLELKSHILRRQGATELTADAHGQFADRALMLNVKNTVVTDRGGVSTRGVALDLGGQKIHVEGSLSPDGKSEGLVLRFGPLSIQEFARWTRDPSLVGEVEGRIDAKGSISVPIVSFDLSGRDLGRKDRPLVQLKTNGNFDARTGNAEIEVSLSSSRLLDARLAGAWNFRGGTGFVHDLTQGTGQTSFDLNHLDSALVGAYIAPSTIPVAAHVRAEIDAHGSLVDPTLDSKITVVARPETKGSTEVVHRLRYTQGEASTTLDVSDRHGTWARLAAGLTLPSTPPDVRALVAHLTHAGSESTWEANLTLARRRLDQIPLIEVVTNSSELPPVLSELRVDVHHAPHQEPNATARVSLEQDSSVEVAGCHSSTLRIEATLAHRDTANELRILGKDTDRELLRIESNVDYPFSPVLAGNPPKLGPVDIVVHSGQLALETLPFVCGRAQGRVDLDIQGSNLFSESPHIEADMKAIGLSLGSRDKLDLHVTSEATPDRVSADVKFMGQARYQGAWGHLRAQVPWTFRSAKISLDPTAPLDARVEFKKFPISPLLPPDGPVSYASGTLDADITARGQLIAPSLHGTLDLNRLAFTSTALAQPLSDITGHMKFDDRKVTLKNFEAHDQKGKLEINGWLDVSNMMRIKSELSIKADDFPLRQRGQVVAVTTLELDAESTITPEQTEVRLNFANVDTWLETVAIRMGIPLDAHAEFVIDGRVPRDPKQARQKRVQSKAAQAVDAPELAPRSTEPEVSITIDAHERFWVKRDDFAVKLEALLDVKISEGIVRVLGDVTIDRGYLQLFGKVFDLKREGKVRFIGSSPPNPVLELEAEHKTRGGEIVSVRITGRGNAPVLTFFIDGTQVDAGVAVQELFGGEKGGSNSDATSQAQNFVSGLTAGILATAARRELGAAAPIIMIDPAEKAGEGRVRAGFELDQLVPGFLKPVVTGAYLEGVAARESQGNSNPTAQFGALLELYFPKNFFTAGQYGPGTTWSIDFGWQL